MNPLALFMFSLAIPSLAAHVGPNFSTYTKLKSNFIRSGSHTLTVPPAPANSTGTLTLYIGLTAAHLYIEATVEHSPENGWVAYASTRKPKQERKRGEKVGVKEGDIVSVQYEYNDDDQAYDQSVYVSDILASTISTESGKAGGWGSSVVCDNQMCGDAPQHTWRDAEIVLDEAEPLFNNTLYVGALTAELETIDEGQTWRIEELRVPEWQF